MTKTLTKKELSEKYNFFILSQIEHLFKDGMQLKVRTFAIVRKVQTQQF